MNFIQKISSPIFKICLNKLIYLVGLIFLCVPFYNFFYGNVEKKGCMNGYFFGLIFVVLLSFIISIMFLIYLVKNNSLVIKHKLLYVFYLIPLIIFIGFISLIIYLFLFE